MKVLYQLKGRAREMVSLEQVMLPYMSDHTGQTLYEYMVERRLQLPQEASGA